jgi:hypothetical protein
VSTLKSINVIHPSSATNNIVNDASGNVAIGNNLTVAGTATVGGVAAVAVAPSTAGNVLTSTGSAWASTAPSGGGLPTPSAIGQIPFSTNGSTYAATQKIVQGTAVATTSGTAIDFTGIPSWVKRITIVFNTVTFSGAAVLYVQLGTSAGIDAASYVATGTLTTGAAGGATVSSTTSYVVRTGSGYSITGSMTIQTLSSNLWVSDHTGTGGGGLSLFGGGVKTLSGTLDRLRITSSTGTDTFTVGSVNIFYE